jgi:ADP-ribose pyrophosphatase YjhB (NUDIX family)
VRGKEPGKGKLDFPGGFVDPNEGVIEALRRECREELSFDPGENINFLASFPNQYPYKNVVYNTCDMFFIVKVSGLNEKDFTLDTENSGVSFLKPEEIDPQDFAFVSARKAFMLYRDSLRKTRGLPS